MSDTHLLEPASKRRIGRPKAAEPRSSVSAWIPVAQHDQLVKLATQRGVSVSQVVNALVSVGLRSRGSN